ncbi:MAG: choice-of-anchor P family protein [Gammaproteobacteria bacterium]
MKSGPLPSVTLPEAGGGPFTASVLGLNTEILKTGLLEVRTEGGDLGMHSGFAKSSARASNVAIGAGLVTAGLVTSQCRSDTRGSGGASSLTNVKVAGAAVAVDPAPNTRIVVPGVAEVVLNEQKAINDLGSTAITANALRVTLFNVLPFLRQEVIVAQSRCSASGPDVNVPPCRSLLGFMIPAVIDHNDAQAVELGVRFRSDVPGTITGVRFYKSQQNTGPHVGHLWTTTGQQLAEVTFTDETASGWQEASFTPPVSIDANTTYVASYHTTKGHYSANNFQFKDSGVDCAPLHAVKDGVDGANGVFQYGAPGFPTETFQSTNYWVDVVFEP